MQITKDYLEKQLEILKGQREQHLANANAANGAIQTYENLLAYITIPEPSTEGTPPHEGS